MNSRKDPSPAPPAGASNSAGKLTKRLRDGGRLRGRGPSALTLACCAGVVVVSVWAPVNRAQLILSAVAVIAIWLRPQDN